MSQLPWGHSRQGGGEDTEGCPGSLSKQMGVVGSPTPVRKAIATGTAGLQGCSCRPKGKDHEPAGPLPRAAAPSMTPPLWAYLLQDGDAIPTAGLKPRPCRCWRQGLKQISPRWRRASLSNAVLHPAGAALQAGRHRSARH